jgi:hypothetical protein
MVVIGEKEARTLPCLERGLRIDERPPSVSATKRITASIAISPGRRSCSR